MDANDRAVERGISNLINDVTKDEIAEQKLSGE